MKKNTGDDLWHEEDSLRLLPSGPDLVQISSFHKIPGETSILAAFALFRQMNLSK